MLIVLNGEKREVPDGINVSDLLSYFKLDNKILVVELNRSILDKEQYTETLLHEADQLEIVHFVGGG